jgi:anti-sigma regulatory factor (Ser/Thr protein kinase)
MTAETLPATEASRQFPPERLAPAAARRFVVEALSRWGHDRATVDDARLIVSELATNAVVHACAPFTVVVRSQDECVHVAVKDPNPAAPTVRACAEAEISGRGLQLVGAVASAWGVEPAVDGKTVWAEVRSPALPDRI